MSRLASLLHLGHKKDSDTTTSAPALGAVGPAPIHVCGVGIGTKPRLDPRMLAKLGCNAIRTWGTDQLDDELITQCRDAGVAIWAGIWLQCVPSDRSAADAVQKKILSDIDRWSRCPEIKVWLVGNELEHRSAPADAARFTDEIARAVKERDPLHRPVGTVVAEIDETKVSLLNGCANVDYVGVNTYGGLPTLQHRVTKFGLHKPYFIGEYTGQGPWEVSKTPWAVPLEPNSYEKAATSATITSTCVGASYLGSFLFLGAYKVEVTPTWFSLLVPLAGGRMAVDWPRLAAAAHMWASRGEGAPVPAPPVIRMIGITGGQGAGHVAWFESSAGQTIRATFEGAEGALGSGGATVWQCIRGAAPGCETVWSETACEAPSTCTIVTPRTPGCYFLHLGVPCASATSGVIGELLPLAFFTVPFRVA